MLNRPNKTTLGEIQNWLSTVITDPHGAGHALSESTIKPEQYIHSTEIDALSRLNVYAEAYFSRIVECLEADFKTTQQIVGDDAFRQLIADYLIEHPSRSANIGEVGRQLPKFILGHPYATEIPYLADVIAFEWAAVESFYSDSAPPFDFTILANFSESDWAEAQIKLQPSLRFYYAQWAIADMWNARHQPNEVFCETEAGILKSNNSIALWCVGGEMRARDLSRAEMAALNTLKNKGSLSSLSSLITAQPEVGEHLMLWFGEWTKLNLISGVELNRKL